MMQKYTRLLAVQLRASSLLAVQYRTDAVIDALVELFYATTAVVPLLVVFRTRGQVAGWSFGASLLVVGWFTLLQAVLEGAINPSLNAVVEHVRKGTLDFVLLKPADAQFLVSTARFNPSSAINVVTASVIFGFGFADLHRAPSLIGAFGAFVLLIAGTVVLYGLWILAVSASFFVVRIDNLSYLFTSVFDAARWPRSVFRGIAHVLFTFVLPFAMMTSYPAEALLGDLTMGRFFGAVFGALVFAIIARLVWSRALGHYTSASS